MDNYEDAKEPNSMNKGPKPPSPRFQHFVSYYEDEQCAEEESDAHMDFNLSSCNNSQHSENSSSSSYKIPEGNHFSKKNTREREKPLTRKRQRDPSSWKSETTKKVRTSERPMGTGCVNCRFSCQKKITLEQRRSIHEQFWALENHTRRWEYIAQLMQTTNCLEESHTKTVINRYFFNVSGTKVSVSNNVNTNLT